MSLLYHRERRRGHQLHVHEIKLVSGGQVLRDIKRGERGEERGHVTKWRNLYLNPTTSKFCQFQKWHIYSLVSLSLFEQSVQHLPHGKRIWWNSLSLQVTMDDLHLTLYLFLSNLFFFFNESTSKQPMKTCPLTDLVDCMINVLQTNWCHNLVECWIYRLCWDLDCKLLSVAL